MATDFTQDAVLHFLQSSGGSVRNADLLLHFRGFVRDHADRDRNRELFKKFVNSVATVQQVDGVSHVVLRKKFRGHVPGDGERGPPRVPAGKNAEPAAANARQSPAGRAEKLPQRSVTSPAGAAVLPAAGIVQNNNNKVEANLNLRQKRVVSSPEGPGRPAAAPVRGQTPSLPHPPAQDRHTEGGQRSRGVGPPPAVVSAVRQQGETARPPGLDPQRGRPGGGLHQEPPLPPLSHLPQVALRRKYRPSYKAAVSYDDDEEEEEVQVRRGSTGGAWPVSVPLGDSVKAISASSPCIIEPRAPPSVSSSSSDQPLPTIHVHNVKEETVPSGGPYRILKSGLGQREGWAGLEPGSAPEEWESSRRSLPSEAERHMMHRDAEEEVVRQPHVHTDLRYSQPAGVHMELRHDPGQNQRVGLSSSHSHLFSPSSEAGLSSSAWPPSGSARGPGWNSSHEDLQSRPAGEVRRSLKIQDALCRARNAKAHHSEDNSVVPWHHSTDLLHVDPEPTARGLPWRLSTGDLRDDREEAESSEGSTFSSPRRPTLAGRMSSQLRSRMCRSLGADLDQLLQEEARGGGVGGSEAARLNRLQLISSSLSLPYNLSSSSLSSCSTPPRCHSMADLVEGVEGRGGRTHLPAATTSTPPHDGSSRQSLVPLEPQEHAWLVKGAAGAWPDIYSLFREDTSLLNRRDFISGFTVLHWIAKHGDHRVLNTLWYGVQKAGLTFDINARSTSGHTPLHIAAIHGHKNVMRLLVSKFDADVRLRDTAGKKPWQYLSRGAASDVLQLLGAPPRAAGRGEAGAGRADKPEQRHRRRRRHHFSSASSGERPVTVIGTTKVKRSSSIAAFLKHKSLRRFHGHQSDSSI